MIINQKNKKFITFITLSIFFSLCFFSCVAFSEIEFSKIDNAISNADYKTAVTELEDNSKKYYSNSDKVLCNLDQGILQHFAKLYDKSNKTLSIAELEIEKNFAKSVSQTISSFLINDSVIDYPGETYENIYTNIFKCLNYIQLGNLEDAMVEIRRFDNKMKIVGKEYQPILDNQRKQMANDKKLKQVEFLDSNVNFHNSAFARYLSLLLYRTDGDFYSAKIDYEKIQDAFSMQPSVYNFQMPKNIEDELVLPSQEARVNVICFTGKSPIKLESSERYFLDDIYYKFSLPIMYHFPTKIKYVQVVLIGQDNKNYKMNLHLLESIDNIAGETYKQHFASIYARALARSVSKALKTGIYQSVSDNAEDDNTKFLFSILNIFSTITTEVSETADLRISRYFPGYVSVGGISVPEGIYNVEVKFYNENMSNIYTYYLENYKAEIGKLNLIESVYQH